MEALPATHPVVVIQVEGVFDVRAAEQLARTLAEGGGLVRVDLRQVREFHDFGVALLARSLSGRKGVTVLGLRQHHVRLLRYLGIATDPVDYGAVAELA